MFLRFLIKSAEKFFREAPFDGSGNIFWEVHNTLSRKISTPYKKLSVPLFIPYLKYQLGGGEEGGGYYGGRVSFLQQINRLDWCYFGKSRFHSTLKEIP